MEEQINIAVINDVSYSLFIVFEFTPEVFNKLNATNISKNFVKDNDFKEFRTDVYLFNNRNKSYVNFEKIEKIYCNENILNKKSYLLDYYFKNCSYSIFYYENKYYLIDQIDTIFSKNTINVSVRGQIENRNIFVLFSCSFLNDKTLNILNDAFTVYVHNYRIINNLNEYIDELKYLRVLCISKKFHELNTFTLNLSNKCNEYLEKLKNTPGQESTYNKKIKENKKFIDNIYDLSQKCGDLYGRLLSTYLDKKAISILDVDKCDRIFNNLLSLLPNIISSLTIKIDMLNYFTLPFYKDFKFFYRGVNEPYHIDLPKVYRGNEVFYREEHNLYKDFLSRFPNDFKGLLPLEILAKMQHYYLPTRLLDITSNPLVALYMACAGDDELQNKMGEIIVYYPSSFADFSDLCDYDSDIITALCCLPELNYFEKNTLKDFAIKYRNTEYSKEISKFIKNGDEAILPSSINLDEIRIFANKYNKFIKICKKYKPDFNDDEFDFRNVLGLCFVECSQIDERIKAQSGGFLVYGLDKGMRKNSSRSSSNDCRILIKNKKSMLKELETLNISNGTMFPDKEHVAKDMIKDIH